MIFEVTVRLLLLLLSLITILSATEIDSFLKPVTDDGEGHSFGNINQVYVINLDHRTDRWNRSLSQLIPYGINPCRFSAIYGKELTVEEINQLGIVYNNKMRGGFMATYFVDEGRPVSKHEIIQKPGRVYFCHCLSTGPIAIVLSHLSVLQDAYDKGYETIWVMEDDIDILQDPKKINTAIEHLDVLLGKEGWDVLFTDRDTRDSKGNYVPCTGSARKLNFTPRNEKQYYVRYDLDEEFERIGARFGAYSMVLRRSGVKKILDFIKKFKIYLPYDLEFYLPHNIRLFCMKDEVVVHSHAVKSDNN